MHDNATRLRARRVVFIFRLGSRPLRPTFKIPCRICSLLSRLPRPFTAIDSRPFSVMNFSRRPAFVADPTALLWSRVLDAVLYAPTFAFS